LRRFKSSKKLHFNTCQPQQLRGNRGTQPEKYQPIVTSQKGDDKHADANHCGRRIDIPPLCKDGLEDTRHESQSRDQIFKY
jgi:hypothetical protein